MSAVPTNRNQYVVHWPEPPHVRLANHLQKPEACEIEFLSGARERGELLHFTGRDKVLIFKPHADHAHHKSLINVALSKVRQVRLLDNVEMRPLELDVAEQVDVVFPPGEVQVYSIEFTDGTILLGETIGYVKLPAGLCLYFNTEGLLISRIFIPDSAIAYSQIGDPIGKLLVDEHVVSEDQLKEAVEKQQAMRKLVLGDYLIEQNIITREQLAEALVHQQQHPSLRLGEALIELKVLTQEQLQATLSRQRAARGRPLGQILVDMGVLDAQTLKKVNAKKVGQPFVSLKNFVIHPAAAKAVPAAVARRLGVVGLAVEDGSLIIAAEGPMSSIALSELGLLARMRIVPVMAPGSEIRAAQDACYGSDPAGTLNDPDLIRFEGVEEIEAQAVDGQRVADLFDSGGSLEFNEDAEPDSSRALLQAVKRLLEGTGDNGTLDIHIESRAGSRSTRISFRKSN